MLVVQVLLYKLQFFHSGSIFTLRIVRLDHSQVFYRLGFPRSSHFCVLYFSALYLFYTCWFNLDLINELVNQLRLILG